MVIARALASDPRVLLLNDPTRGVDIGAKRDIYALLRELAAAGMAIVMLSTEVDEHLELMDRVLVFRDGAPAAELRRERDLSRAAIVSEFFGTVPTADDRADSSGGRSIRTDRCVAAAASTAGGPVHAPARLACASRRPPRPGVGAARACSRWRC